jgi:hypothetical protein
VQVAGCNFSPRASKAGRLNIQVVATSGEGFGGLADLVKALSANPEALKNIFEALAPLFQAPAGP